MTKNAENNNKKGLFFHLLENALSFIKYMLQDNNRDKIKISHPFKNDYFLLKWIRGLDEPEFPGSSPALPWPKEK